MLYAICPPLAANRRPVVGFYSDSEANMVFCELLLLYRLVFDFISELTRRNNGNITCKEICQIPSIFYFQNKFENCLL